MTEKKFSTPKVEMFSDVRPDICIYHGGCDDGFTAAWAVWKVWQDVQFVPHGYSKCKIPDEELKDKYIVMVDFSFKRDELKRIAALASQVVIIDHHKTAMEDLREPIADNVWVIFDMDHSGGYLTWEFYHSVEWGVPPIVRYTEDRDLWIKKLPCSEFISRYTATVEKDFQRWTNYNKELDDDSMFQVIAEIGQNYDDYFKFLAKEFVRNAFDATIKGVKCKVVNVPYQFASDVGNMLAGPDNIGVTFLAFKDSFLFSLRSTQEGPDASAVAIQFGGGGHRNACGFPSKTFDVFDHEKPE